MFPYEIASRFHAGNGGTLGHSESIVGRKLSNEGRISIPTSHAVLMDMSEFKITI